MDEENFKPLNVETSTATSRPEGRGGWPKYLKIGAVVFGSLVLGFILLRFLGGYLISEVKREIIVDKAEIESAVVGQKAPYFELKDLSGSRHKLSDFYGSPLVIVFWTNWNRESLDQLKVLDDYLRKSGEGLFKIVAVNQQEDRSVVLNLVNRGGYVVRVLLDQEGAVGEVYGVRNLPLTYILDREGVIRDVFLGVLNENMLVEKVEKVIR